MATDPRPLPVRRLLGVLVALLLPALYVVAGAGAASAASGYKYWNYFHVEGGKYAFAQTGPADYKPRNGAVEAYRYGLSSSAKGLQPRTGATTYSFEKLCAGTKAQQGEKRVGVLVDYGTSADAAGGDTPPDPRGDCAVVPSNANGQQVLDAVSDLRVEKGLVCGIDGYPSTGCSVTVKNPPAAQAEQDVDFKLPAGASDSASPGTSASSDSGSSDDGGVPWTLVGVVAAVVVIGGAALALSRRNRTA
jgi:hypothetical protein